jgi:hypothetical protein
VPAEHVMQLNIYRFSLPRQKVTASLYSPLHFIQSIVENNDNFRKQVG